MSQQSVMATVVPYFHRWMERFPTLEALAAASEHDVLAQWAGLGYYSRARNALKTARALDDYRRANRGAWPQTPEAWRALPGVGPYTAAAVTASVWGARVLPLDGNVVRVLSRLEGIPNPLNEPKDRKLIEARLAELARDLPDGEHPWVAQALMELGALVCRPGAQARCPECPLRASCRAFRQNKITAWPQPKLRPVSKNIKSLALVYRDPKNRVLLRQIPPGERLAGQWELPRWDMDSESFGHLRPALREHFDVSPKAVRHAITTNAYEVYRVEAGRWTGRLPEAHRYWAPREGAHQGVVTTLTRKIMLIEG